ncbi:type I restriction endonuclease subunit R [Pseudoalteromonas luteoviolacea]|uniref:Type I restriction enzyme endonuclease subunit n=1 Tax=Pseudoalteromonas luteoviolacea DSM 6061 TaxID=1365250 RepID=A0A166XY99_9GAMM|nr:type I restriction endonuclease subunit R [Pseudoalteromonas luteoviolacea]KZN41037.1 type I restriction endonuclease [Pseudoalteromonas luteoviolacea DSM 6061]MBE0386243.1 type I restriction enzyme, R subunit [Pseudoalteromonas luteoviolacea DSM 6061]
MKFTEAQLEAAIIELLAEQGYPYTSGAELSLAEGARAPEQVLITEDLKAYLVSRYAKDDITQGEVDSIIKQLENLPASDLYESNKTFCKWLSDGFLLKREAGSKPGEASKKDLYIQLIDYDDVIDGHNVFKFVNQLEIESPSADNTKRIPDGILYINGLPLVVFEFKSAIREEQASLHDAYVQLTTRYRRDIPQLFVFNALCIISDGVNNKMGNVFAPYDFYYAWRKVTGDESVEQDGINALHTMLQGLFDKERLCDVIRNFIYFPDKSKGEVKIVCRYPQYYAARKLFENIKKERKVIAVDGTVEGGSGKGGTYFGATGCGKSFTMQFLSRLLMKSVEFESPTIVLITDRTDLDDQLSKQFANAKSYIGDDHIVSVESRDQLRQLLKGRQSGGVFLTTIHKFTEDIELLTERTNVICISDEAHRSQVNLDQKVSITEQGVKRTFGFAKYLHDSLPNATFVGFTGTPIDATLDVFGEVVDAYTMSESVKDEITVRIVYEGRAAKVLLNNAKLEEIEAYYKQCEESGSNEHQIEESKKATSSMNSILGGPDRIRTLAKDFVEHYEARIREGSTIKGKAMFVCSSREIAYQFYQALEAIRPEWFEIKEAEDIAQYSEQEKKGAISAGKLAKPMERVKMVMTRGKDDPETLYNLLGTKEYRKELDRQFKNDKSNFKIAIVVDMWLTGFDVPFLDTIYIDKPLQKHNLIQTISRVNRKFSGKHKGLVVDYIGIKTAMNKALAQFSKSEETNFEDINQSVIAVKDHLDLLSRIFHKFDSSPYFTGEPVAQLNCLNNAAEFILSVGKLEKRFMALVKRLKAAYDICCGSEKLSQKERDYIHFYLAVRSIIYKLTKGDAPDTTQMNAKVREMISEALKSDGVEEIFKLGNDDGEIDIFDEDYLAKISKIKLPNTKIMLLQKMLAKAIGEMKKVNLAQGVDFTKRFKALVEKYNERKEEDVLVSEVLEDFSDEIITMFTSLKSEMDSNDDLGISFEEKAFYDILKSLAIKYDFSYPEDKLIELAQEVKEVVDDKAKYTDWNNRDDIKASLKVDLIMLLAKFGYPPVNRDEVYKEIFAQAENFKKHRAA